MPSGSTELMSSKIQTCRAHPGCGKLKIYKKKQRQAQVHGSLETEFLSSESTEFSLCPAACLFAWQKLLFLDHWVLSVPIMASPLLIPPPKKSLMGWCRSQHICWVLLLLAGREAETPKLHGTADYKLSQRCSNCYISFQKDSTNSGWVLLVAWHWWTDGAKVWPARVCPQ